MYGVQSVDGTLKVKDCIGKGENECFSAEVALYLIQPVLHILIPRCHTSGRDSSVLGTVKLPLQRGRPLPKVLEEHRNSAVASVRWRPLNRFLRVISHMATGASGLIVSAAAALLHLRSHRHSLLWRVCRSEHSRAF